MAIDEARAELITFSDYPEMTTITNQYQSLGVIFSGAPQPPYIYHPAPFGVTDPSLASRDPDPSWGSGVIIAEFVNPADGTPTEATNVHFDWWALGQNPYTFVWFTCYDINGNIIYEKELLFDGQPQYLVIPPKLHKFVFTPTRTYLSIDNQTFQTAPPAPSLVDPGPCTEKGCEDMAGQPINLTTGDV
jgi:hypothetical protein